MTGHLSREQLLDLRNVLYECVSTAPKFDHWASATYNLTKLPSEKWVFVLGHGFCLLTYNLNYVRYYDPKRIMTEFGNATLTHSYCVMWTKWIVDPSGGMYIDVDLRPRGLHGVDLPTTQFYVIEDETVLFTLNLLLEQ